MRRTLIGWHTDELGGWVAELDCLHHHRLQEPLAVQGSASAVDEVSHQRTMGAEVTCERCDRAELPAGLVVLRTTDVWDETTAPRALRRRHRVAPRRWALIRVLDGTLGFHADTSPVIETTIDAGGTQAVPPEVEHHITVVGPVRFCLDFLGLPSGGASPWASSVEEG